jgi:hypothetical protein
VQTRGPPVADHQLERFISAWLGCAAWCRSSKATISPTLVPSLVRCVASNPVSVHPGADSGQCGLLLGSLGAGLRLRSLLNPVR